MESFYVLLAFIISWAVAHLIKFVIFWRKKKRKMTGLEVMRQVFRSGGMPSGHTASFTGAMMMTGFVVGFSSVVFALAVCMEFIIVYDAINVRYAVGEQGKKLNKLLEDKDRLKVVEGHTFLEVIVGFLIGIAVSALLALILIK